MREQELLLRSLQQCDFTLYELQLYLDTHPNCKRAMEKYGPIRPSQSNTTERWNWVDAPWPWEKEANCDVDV